MLENFGKISRLSIKRSKNGYLNCLSLLNVAQIKYRKIPQLCSDTKSFFYFSFMIRTYSKIGQFFSDSRNVSAPERNFVV
jgi:hypothetical protein